MKKTIVLLIILTTTLLSWDNTKVNYRAYENQPRYGVEINPFRLITLGSSWSSFSGSFSIFNYDNNSEIAFPMLYSEEESDEYYDSDYNYSSDFKVFTLDAHYRKFLDNRVGGLYVSGVARVAKLEGRLKESEIEDNGKNYAKVTKLGLGLGIGYRLLPKLSQWYWGFGLVVGHYFGSDNDMFDADMVVSSLDDSSVFIDIELLKIGYRF